MNAPRTWTIYCAMDYEAMVDGPEVEPHELEGGVKVVELEPVLALLEQLYDDFNPEARAYGEAFLRDQRATTSTASVPPTLGWLLRKYT